MLSRTILVLATMTAALGACSGDPEPGGACEDGSACEAGLYCFVPEKDMPGTCKTLPESCGDDPSCDCLEEERMSCAGDASGCLGIGNRYTVVCGQ